MKFSGFSSYMTGILIPVFTLRTSKSCGTGEFLDLIDLAGWCEKAGLNVVQLLPVNDTGDDPSPYNALSAQALNPVYIRIDAVPEFKKLPAEEKKRLEKQLSAFRKESETQDRVRYKKVLDEKLSLLKTVFDSFADKISADAELEKWMKQNPWVRDYGAFRTLKALHKNHGWQSWKNEYKHGNDAVISRVWQDPELGTQARFYAWVQFRLEAQFAEAAHYLNSKGIMLKGDIPIMMNEDSVDVWAHGQNFQLDLRAGAPPDMFSQVGQNWGFPIYNWDYLEAHDYQWWRDRLRHADRFYQAYRIDHVLGFFRLWTIDKSNREGLLGFFKPSIYISKNDLYAIGFDDGRIRWLCEPHVHGWKIREAFAEKSLEVTPRCFNRIGGEDLFVFKPEVKGEKSILELPLSDAHKNTLVDWFRDRALLSIDTDLFATTWTFRDCGRYQGLNQGEKDAFEALVAKRAYDSEQLWKKNGMKLLSFMKQTVPMLTCAEDLGVIPASVPVTLKELGILSLKIPRWAREWDKQGQPYLPIDQYPFLSVCAPSVHDTSTLRDWWEHEQDKWGFWTAMNFKGTCPDVFSPAVAQTVIEKLLTTSSALCLFQIQDLFAIEEKYRAVDSRNERVNIPGTVQDFNWSYRLPITIEELSADEGFAGRLAELVAARSKRALPA